MFLPDINLWLALAFASHVHHKPASDWFDALQDDRCAFSRMTQQGFLRLATNPKAVGADVLSLTEAWTIYDTFHKDPFVTFVGEPEGVEPLWRGYTEHQSFSHKVWNDAYLAAFARAAGYELITFDKGFSRYAGLKHTILS
jgi:uncharacterized protein